MVETLWVYLDCDALPSPALVGRLTRKAGQRASECVFEFEKSWLADHSGLCLSSDLTNRAGEQRRPEAAGLFSCFADVLPNRWGRLLLESHSLLLWAQGKRPPGTPGEFERLLLIDDGVRAGGLRFKRAPSEPFLNTGATGNAPAFSSLEKMTEAVGLFEESERRESHPREEWFLPLLRAGASLGGAWPKVSVWDEEGNLWIAKLPSGGDSWNVGAWERLAYLLAERAGIETAPSRVVELGPNRHAFLVKRFDRVGKMRRHYASALTLTGLTEKEGAATGHGYLDIAEAVLEHFVDVEQNLEALYRRVAFNITIGNTDDHFRNHGFLLTKRGWTLSPAFDLNPTGFRRQSLLIDGKTEASNPEVLRKSAARYFLKQQRAERILDEVLAAVRDWRGVADELAIPEWERELFAYRFLCG